MGESSKKSILEQGEIIRKIWLPHTAELGEKISRLAKQNSLLGSDVNDWIAMMPEMKNSHKKLFYEHLPNVEKKLYEYSEYLSYIPLKEKQWDKWDWESMKKKMEKLHEELDKISGAYLNDFFVEVHNELLGKAIKNNKKFREDFNTVQMSDNIFTKDGEVSVEKISKKVST